MDHLRRLARVGRVGHVERRQEGRIERLVDPAAEPGDRLHLLPREVHVDQPLVDLDHAVLEPGGDAQLVGLHRQDQGRLDALGDFDPVKFHQAAEGGHDDRARAGQPDLPWDVALVADREVSIVEPETLLLAILDESLYGGLHQADAAVIAVQVDVLRKLFNGSEPAVIFLAEDDLHLVPFVKRRFGPVVADDERDRLAGVAVGRVSDQPRPGVGPLADQEHGPASSG